MASRPELLDIGRAAAFLGVSETSLRRWTNAGLLPCFRIGGRRERRFRLTDLLAFLERSDVVGRPSPAHRCGMYRDAAARERLAADFLLEGLETGSTCFMVAAPAVRKRVLARVAEQRPGGLDDDARRRLVVGMYAADARAQLHFWESSFVAATRAGSPSLRVVGDVLGGRLRSVPLEDVLAYECEYQRSLSSRFPVTTLCLYDARLLSGVQATHVLDAHTDMLRAPLGASPTRSQPL